MSGRWMIAALLLVVAVVAVVLVSVLYVPQPEISAAISPQKGDPARGRYVAVLGDCAACHTAPGGKPFAGGLPFPTPVGTIYSGNLTPDRQYGIGSYSFTDFVRVMRLGVAPDGSRLYPAMPYTAYAKVFDEDLRDLFAYLQQGVAVVNEAPPANPIRWPLSMRWPLVFWDIAFHDASRFAVDASKDAQWNRGAYLVQGLAHCGTCHTPRGVAFQEVDVSGKTNLYLSGSVLDNVSPINLRSNPGDGLGRWSVSEVAALLKSGRSEHSAVTGSMAEVVHDSTQHMAEPDIVAIAGYLKSLSPAPAAGRATFAESDATFRTIIAGDERSIGGRIFMDSCSACHRLSGSGQSFAFPSLAGNSSVLSADPSSLIAVILNGARVPSTADAPSGLAMPAFGWRYDDDDIASLATFVRSSWGNGAAPVTAAQVASLRKQFTPGRPNP
jgi:mono/diheme cytochrome c family protein